MSRTNILSNDVREILRADEQLAIVYFAHFSTYDADIDPLHNPDWRVQQEVLEKERLNAARVSLERARGAVAELF